MKWSCWLALVVVCGCAEEGDGTKTAPSMTASDTDAPAAPSKADLPAPTTVPVEAEAPEHDEEDVPNVSDGRGDGAGGDHLAPPSPTPARVHLTGAVQKGPFVAGSAILVTRLDDRANPTGAFLSASTRNDMGEFELELEANELVAIAGTGIYYNEATGAISAAAITLRGLHQTGGGGQQEAYVNTITHVTFARMTNLIGDGATLDEARARAEWELQIALGIAPAAFSAGIDASRMNLLGGDSDANSYLFAVSSVLAFAAQITNWEDQTAALQELLDRLSLDLAGDGEIQANERAAIEDARFFMQVEDVEAAFAERLRSLDSAAAFPDLDRSIDHDGDGLVNALDNCRRMSNAQQEDTDGDGTGDACDDAFPLAMLCVYAPAIVASVPCNPDSIFLQCSGIRTNDIGVRGPTGGSIAVIYDGWLATPDFPRPDCASTQPDAPQSLSWLAQVSLDENENPISVTPLRALSSEEFSSLPHPPDAPLELIFDDQLLTRLEGLESGAQ